MSDVIDASMTTPPTTMTPIADASATTAWPAHLERRRPGRNNDISPQLIALMRKPTDEARRAVALYDAPNFVLPPAPSTRPAMTAIQFVRILTAGGVCALVWAVAIRAMMVVWG